MRDAACVTFEAGHHALDQVGGVQTFAQVLRHSQAMECQRFVQAFLYAARGGAVDRLELLHEALQRAFGIVMPGMRIRRQ